MGVVVLQITTEQTISWLCKKKEQQRLLKMSNFDILSWEWKQADWIQWNSCQKRPLK